MKKMINEGNKEKELKEFSERYSRQIRLKEIGEQGQEVLTKSTIVIVGIGALGTVAAELLARSGVGNLTLIDRDTVELSNLQRQILFTEKDVGKSKALTAKERIGEINPLIKAEGIAVHLDTDNISLLKGADVILDCTDNLQTRYLINDFCKKNKIPWVYASAIKTSGYVMLIPPKEACISCFLPGRRNTHLETCEQTGVLNSITATIAALQAGMSIKILLEKKVSTKLYYIDAWNFRWKEMIVKKKEGCPACQGRYLYLEGKQRKPIRFCSSGRYQIQGKKVDFNEIKKRWEKIDTLIYDDVSIRFKGIMLFADGRALIKAKCEEEAQAMYSKWVGN
ncbi:HesA/MoeB/ThiF family protein [Candidatus Woesearchaeota archaeon]|nr:HesA/MoeB/ThiF family protein [Candidatus Woesearchaeota archaeon]